jgi:pimeloyl-ACP methyl ester carboxylesterase
VAHGLAVPAVVYAATLNRFPGIVLSNGPLARVDRVSTALRKARFALRVLLLPPVWTAWLRSSAGLRRAVVNPYVMDRDTVAALCGGLVETNAGRAQVAAWLSALETLPELAAPLAPTLILWGEADPLYPASEASYGASRMVGSTYVAVPGGHHIHPVERPWEMADRLGAWLQDHALAG